MFEPAILATVFATLFIAGFVKGIVGLGLPTVSLALFTLAFDLKTAMAVFIVPSLVTNLYQAAMGGHAKTIMRKHWPFFLSAGLFIPIGVAVSGVFKSETLSVLLGAALVFYAVAGLASSNPRIPPERERNVGLALGAINGVLTGLTGSFVFPGVAFLRSVGLDRDALIQAMGILFTISTIVLAIALERADALENELIVLSCVSTVPALFGMALGAKVRDRLTELVFRRFFFFAILVLGCALIGESVFTPSLGD
ncbi:MAG: sulfite exporter TauE/SafE family protein [Pseudomonadota bacterium]